MKRTEYKERYQDTIGGLLAIVVGGLCLVILLGYFVYVRCGDFVRLIYKKDA